MNKIEYEIPITKEIDKTKRIDKENRKVITENRGVFTNPPKKGTSSTPGILFAYFKENPEIPEKRGRSKYAYPVSIHDKTFKPASLTKNLPFINDKATYGEEISVIEDIMSKSMEEKLNPSKKKFEGNLPPGARKHEFPFKPACFGKSVEH